MLALKDREKIKLERSFNKALIEQKKCELRIMTSEYWKNPTNFELLETMEILEEEIAYIQEDNKNLLNLLKEKKLNNVKYVGNKTLQKFCEV